MRQYTGARYMPKFMGTYDPTTAYEALSVVDNGMGTSYVSNKPAPAGTPLTDTNYWVVYGSSNGAILDLQNRMTDAENDILALQSNFNGGILIVGNSFVGAGCADAIAACFSNNYKMTPYGGIGFVPYTGHVKCFEDVIDDAIMDTSIDKNIVTDILFVSAMGDCRSYHEGAAAFQTALAATFASIMNKVGINFPNCKHVKVTFAESRFVPYFTGGGYSDSNFNDLFDVHKIFKSLCPRNGLEYIGWSGFNNLFVNGMFDSDNYHPNALGAANIGGWIKTSYFGTAEYETKFYNQLLPCTYSAGATVRVLGYYTPEECKVQVRNISNASTGIAVTTVANGDIFDTAVTNAALPAPNVSLDIITPVIDSISYTQDDTLYYSFTKDTYGALKTVSLRNPTAATVTHNSLAAPNVSEVSFML